MKYKVILDKRLDLYVNGWLEDGERRVLLRTFVSRAQAEEALRRIESLERVYPNLSYIPVLYRVIDSLGLEPGARGSGADCC
jgi:hypothetical protein